MPDPSTQTPSRETNPVLVVGGIVGGAVIIGAVVATIFLYALARNGKPLAIRAIDEDVLVRAGGLKELSPQFSIRTEAESLVRRRLFDGTVRLKYGYQAPPPQTLRLESELQIRPEPYLPEMVERTKASAKTILLEHAPESRLRQLERIVPWSSGDYWVAEAYRVEGESEQPTGYAFVGCDENRLYRVVMSAEGLDRLSQEIFLRALGESIDHQRDYEP